jgi:DNA-binding NtrC family response regulator
MENIDGMQFLTEVKERSPATEVIVITGFATMETAKESFQKGVFDFVAKPFKISEILDAVRRAEEKRRAAGH